jgi:hypothetical protein
MVQNSLMTEEAFDLVDQVCFLSLRRASPDRNTQLLRKNPDSRLSDITKIKKHPYFETMCVILSPRKCTIANPVCSDWSNVASRSLTPPWVPRLLSSRKLCVHYREADVYLGKQYTSDNDPLPAFTFRADSDSVSRACIRRQQVFGVLDGCAPVVFWVDGSAYVGDVIHRTPERQISLKTLSRWVKRVLNRPLRSP